MKKLSKEKRDHLILVAVGTAVALGCLWYFLINYQYDIIAATARKVTKTQGEIENNKRIIVNSASTQEALDKANAKLMEIEKDMPSGDLYSWLVATIKQFNKASYKVEIPQLSQPTQGEVVMIPSFPYRQAVTVVAGSAYFYDLGRFLADFENRFPYARIQNLVMEPVNGSVSAEDREKLSFRMEIITLIKPATP